MYVAFSVRVTMTFSDLRVSGDFNAVSPGEPDTGRLRCTGRVTGQ